MNNIYSTITVRRPDEGIRCVSAGNVYRYLATGQETNGKLAVLESVVEPGKGAPFHTHSREEEAFLITKGEMVFYSEKERFVAPTGTFITCPVGTMRGFRNETNNPAHMVILLAPAGLEEMFITDGTVLERDQKADDVGGLREAACPSLSEEFGIINHDIPLPIGKEGLVSEAST
ncbi:cupin domain-containing protein [Kiloniella antarctica]|uniref:Cupin domain-containing protein n=1 Tax=Kiloniella antarctica TaxID=1550907 RepID=A0ABW5BK75_9PROT